MPQSPGAVVVSGGFWAARQDANRRVSELAGFANLRRSGALGNLELVADGGPARLRRGELFADSDVYKWLEAVGWELGRDGSGEVAQQLRQMADHAITVIERAQASDGYLDSWFQLNSPRQRFTDLASSHELYCAGHLLEAAVAWHESLDDDRLLRVARRLADYIGSVFGLGRHDGIPGHPGIETALAGLYRATGEPRYLQLAGYFIDRRGHGTLAGAEFGLRYRQDDVPFRESRSARGHAVMAGYLASGALDVFAESGDEQLLDAAVAQWEDMVSCRMYVTGGVGSRHKDESFGDPFELPPDRAYCETCAAVAVVMWGWRLLLATGESHYADVIERVLLNAFAAGVSLDGQTFFYVNPLQVRAGHQDPEDGRGAAARAPWYPIACCPPNVMRTMSSLGRYFATTTADGVQIWQYAPARMKLSVAGHPVELTVHTDYPFSGRISVRVERAGPEPAEIGLRVPGWAESAHGRVLPAGGEDSPAQAGEAQPGTVWRVRRRWRPGDELILDLPMAVRPTRADPRVDAVRGCVAVQRGPLVYCLEETDVPSSARLESLILPADVAFTPAPAEIADQPVTVLASLAQLRPPPAAGRPYLHAGAATATTGQISIQLVPYSAWGNRHPGQTMRVWIPAS